MRRLHIYKSQPDLSSPAATVVSIIVTQCSGGSLSILTSLDSAQTATPFSYFTLGIRRDTHARHRSKRRLCWQRARCRIARYLIKCFCIRNIKLPTPCKAAESCSHRNTSWRTDSRAKCAHMCTGGAKTSILYSSDLFCNPWAL